MFISGENALELELSMMERFSVELRMLDTALGCLLTRLISVRSNDAKVCVDSLFFLVILRVVLTVLMIMISTMSLIICIIC